MIQIKNVSKSYDGKAVLNGFSCEIPSTGITAFSGASGIGKTTLAKIIANLESADSGSISGLENKKISVVFQEDRLFPHLTALENVSIVSNEQNAREILSDFGLQDDMELKPSEMSGGMCRRVALARAIAFGGDLLILDEPFKGLDADTKKVVFNSVKEFSKSASVLLITHDNDEIENADKIIKLN